MPSGAAALFTSVVPGIYVNPFGKTLRIIARERFVLVLSFPTVMMISTSLPHRAAIDDPGALLSVTFLPVSTKLKSPAVGEGVITLGVGVVLGVGEGVGLGVSVAVGVGVGDILGEGVGVAGHQPG